VRVACLIVAVVFEASSVDSYRRDKIALVRFPVSALFSGRNRPRSPRRAKACSAAKRMTRILEVRVALVCKSLTWNVDLVWTQRPVCVLSSTDEVCNSDSLTMTILTRYINRKRANWQWHPWYPRRRMSDRGQICESSGCCSLSLLSVNTFCDNTILFQQIWNDRYTEGTDGGSINKWKLTVHFRSLVCLLSLLVKPAVQVK